MLALSSSFASRGAVWSFPWELFPEVKLEVASTAFRGTSLKGLQ